MRNWVGEAQEYLFERYKRACVVLDGNPQPPPLAMVPNLDPTEARCFIEGLERALFSVDDEGYVQSPLLPPPSGQNTKQKMLQLFWKKADGRGVFREGICQLATVSSLIIDKGWKVEQIVMEPGKREFRDLAYAVDILIRPSREDRVICGEVKKDAAEFQQLVDGFKACCLRGAHSKAECTHAKNHAKYAFCAEIKPPAFFAAAPGKALCFSLVYDPVLRIDTESATLSQRV